MLTLGKSHGIQINRFLIVVLELMHRRQTHPVLRVIEVVDTEEMEKFFRIVQTPLLIELISKSVEAIHLLGTNAVQVLERCTIKYGLHHLLGNPVLFLLRVFSTAHDYLLLNVSSAVLTRLLSQLKARGAVTKRSSWCS
ncbi:hypothetical protein D3C75_1022080 [compost metagenome]